MPVCLGLVFLWTDRMKLYVDKYCYSRNIHLLNIRGIKRNV